jgi:hypothetical protein
LNEIRYVQGNCLSAAVMVTFLPAATSAVGRLKSRLEGSADGMCTLQLVYEELFEEGTRWK